jgi:acid stress chaperone HdeB
MAKHFIAAVLLLTLGSANAQTPEGLGAKSDLTTLNCKDALNMNRSDMLIVLAYLQAHYRPKDARPIIDTEKLAADGLRLKGYCDANPQKTVIEAADALFGVSL